MLQENESPALAGTSRPGSKCKSPQQNTTSRPELKWRRTLRELLARSGSDNERFWLNRFIAERICRDHVLPSTISELEREKNVKFERREITVAGYAGEPARIMAYRVAPDSIARVRELLGLDLEAA